MAAMRTNSGLLIASLVATSPLLWGCGGGLKYRVDDGALDAVPAGERQGVFEAQKDLEIAKSEQRTAEKALDGWDRDRDVAKAENQQATLEVDKAATEIESANQSRDENRANAAKHQKDAADFGVKVAEQKLSFLDEKKDWLKAARNAAEAHIEAAQAKVELEKAKVAQAKNIKPDGDFSVSNYQDQWNDKNGDWESAKKKAASEEKDSKEAEKKWQDMQAQLQKMRG
jgi:chromosome segregation ATPase